MTTLTIDSEFQSLIPPLADDERAELEASLQAEGCRDALTVWAGQGILVDGHNRYAICQAHGIPFEVKEREFEDRDAAKLWIIGNQLGRRNLTDAARIRLARARAGLLKAEAEKRMMAGRADPSRKSDEGRSDVQAGKIAGVGKDKYRQGEVIIEQAPPALQKKWDAGEITTHRAYLMTRALKDADPEVVDIVTRYGVEEPETVSALKRLKVSSEREGSNGTFEEIAKSGYIQPGEEAEAVHITDSPLRIQDALKLKSGIHRELAGQQRASNFNDSPMASTGNNERYTPDDVVALAVKVLGAIDLDPASCEEANQTVGARRIYTLETNGLAHDWRAENVYLNPPYGDEIEAWMEKLVAEFEAGHFRAAITLVPARTDTAWFRRLRDFPKCFVSGRLKFKGPGIGENSAPFPSCVVYLGSDFIRFASTFTAIGDVYTRWQVEEVGVGR